MIIYGWTRWLRGGRRGLASGLFAVVASIGVFAVPEPALAVAGTADVVKYYVVASQYAGAPETLAEISLRFLGTPGRSWDLLALNANRRQPDGGKLTDPDKLHPGWLIVLSWDAVGTGVNYGPLPAVSPTPTATTARPYPSPTPAASAPTTTGPTSAASPTAPVACAGVQRAPDGSIGGWAQARLSPQQAWSRGHGDGVIVAIVDSGVDAAVPALSGRVNVGADIVAGTGRGNVDCLGTGTAMAGLIVSQPAQGGSVTGIAPGAIVMPVRIVTNTPAASTADQASAIDVAVSAGAGVIALGSYVDMTAPAVLDAVARAAAHNVVVVVGASTTSEIAPSAQLLRVGAMGIDGTLAQDYAEDGVDVVAPGVGITSVGITGTGTFYGTGTQYAVAFVAGQAALIRGLDRTVSAADVAARIRSTATALASGERPNEYSGWGLINLDSSMKPDATKPATAAPAAGPHSGPGPSPAVIWVTMAAAAIVGGLLILRIRRVIRAGHRAGGAPPAAVFGGAPPAASGGAVPPGWNGPTPPTGPGGGNYPPPAPDRPGFVGRMRSRVRLPGPPARPPLPAQSGPVEPPGPQFGAASSYGAGSGGPR